jgi:hypothetical protein
MNGHCLGTFKNRRKYFFLPPPLNVVFLTLSPFTFFSLSLSLLDSSWWETVENGSRGILTVTSRYQATASEDVADWEELECALVICRVGRLVKMLQLFVLTRIKHSINSTFNPKPVSDH